MSKKLETESGSLGSSLRLAGNVGFIRRLPGETENQYHKRVRSEWQRLNDLKNDLPRSEGRVLPVHYD